MYGNQILAVLQRYREGARASALHERPTAPAIETMRLLAEGHSFEEIAKIRGRQLSTVVAAVASIVESGHIPFHPAWLDKNKLSVIEAACAKLGVEKLRPLKDILPPEITFE